MAAAAYRSGQTLFDDRYAELHDYTRKTGIEHTEIMAPEDAPDWMCDRSRLWNEVERIERRKDAQLAREIQLSLPHELSFEQRRDLVRQYVAEQFVTRGMIADLSLHAPDRRGDERNHHAHILLTLRHLDGEGFGQKAREWNDRGNIDRWREEWAALQNREFERLGIDARVDHRSFEARGIDREPEQHAGPAATAMKRKGEQTRIGDENADRAQRNSDRAARHVEALKELAKIAAERQRFEGWAAEKRGMLEAQQSLSRLDLTRHHEAVMDELEAGLRDYYDPHLATVEAEARRIQSGLQAQGILPVLRRMWTAKADRKRLADLQATIDDTHRRMQEAKGKEEAEHRAEMARLLMLQEQRRQQQHEGIERARDRKEQTLSDRLAAATEDVERRERLLKSLQQGAAKDRDKERGPEME